MGTVLSIVDQGLASIIVAIQKRHSSNPELAQVTLDGDGLHFDAQSLLPELNSQDFSMHPAAVGEHLTPAIASLIAAHCTSADRHVFLATAWTNFALMLIKLYVPDKIFDPQLRSQVEAQSHEDLVSDLKAQLESLESFEKLSTGQTFNVRCEILQEEMEGFGPSPPLAQQVYRPAKSGLAELQGEFNNLLKIVLAADVCLVVSQRDHGSPDLVHQLGVIHENICQIANRLSYRFPAYNDMVQPAVNILRCLQVGLSLVVPSTSPHTADGIPEQLRGNVPFAGGRPQDMGPKDPSTYDMHFLAYAGAVSSVEGAQSMNSKLGHSVSEAVHYIYEQWSQ
jgi:midasin